MELLVTSENYLKVYNHSVFESLKDIIEEMRKTKDEKIEFLENKLKDNEKIIQDLQKQQQNPDKDTETLKNEIFE